MAIVILITSRTKLSPSQTGFSVLPSSYSTTTTMTTPQNDEFKTANAPFNAETADVILRTSDCVDFHVHQLVLALASPFFSTMFTLKRPPTSGGECNCQLARADPVPVSEDSIVLDHLLRFCYPLRHPVISDLDVLGRVLEAAIKYDIDCATHVLREMLSARIQDSTLHVYAIACQLGPERIARAAANACWVQHERWLCDKWKADGTAPSLKETLHGHIYDPAFKAVSAGAYFRLLRFLREKRESSNFRKPFGSTLAFFRESPLSQERALPAPAIAHSFTRPDADTILTSADGVHFAVHRVILELASAQSLIQHGSVHEKASVSPTIELHSTTLNEPTSLLSS